MDFFSNRIFIFTPGGDVVDLPEDSTPIDFAYSIHSDIGDHIFGAKINGKMSAIFSKLKNRDIVEIITKRTHIPLVNGWKTQKRPWPENTLNHIWRKQSINKFKFLGRNS